MSKRIYMTPTMEIVKMETTNMIAASLTEIEGEGIGFGGGGDVPLSREFDDFGLLDEYNILLP